MSRGALARSVGILLEEEQEQSQALVDLAISLRVCSVDVSGPEPKYLPATDEELIEVGGVWDRRAKRWAAEPSKTVKIIRIPRGSDQEVAARWLAGWLRLYAQGARGPHWDGFRRVWTLLLEGGRRGGKSFLAVVGLAMFCVMSPRAITWAISPTQEETDELEQTWRQIMPRAWYLFRGGGAGKPLQFRLPNGARLLCLSGHKPRSLKRGRVDVALYNEAQNMYAAGWRQLRGAVADKGGLVMLTANPPDSEIGRWIEDVHERGRAEKIKVQVFRLLAKTNPFVDMRSLEDMADENDELTFRREVLGEFVPIGDIVFHAWSDSESVIDVPGHWVDCTRELTKRHLGRACDYVVGMDFQSTPHMVAIPMLFFRDPHDDVDPAHPDAHVIAVIIDEVVVEDADENDLVDALEGDRPEVMAGRVELVAPATPGGHYLARRIEGEGYPADSCAVVMDASGFDQDGKHNRGRTSEHWLKARGWRWLYKPARDSGRNPDVVERCKVTNSRLKSAAQRRRAFALRHCARVIRSARSWELRGGVPYRRSPFAHVCDGFSYAIYRFFARRKTKPGTPAVSRVNPGTRAAEVQGF